MKRAKQGRTTYRVTIINLDGSVEEKRFIRRNINVKGHVAPEPRWAKTHERPIKRHRQRVTFRSRIARENRPRKHDGIGPF